MEDAPQPHYEAWHIPCYSNQKCPSRIKARSQGLTTPPSMAKQAGFHPLFGYEVSNDESSVVALFLYIVTFMTVGGIIIVFSALVYRKGCRRPLNQFLMFMLKSDLTMALFVIPLHVVEVFEDRTAPLGSVVCLTGTFIHLVSTSSRSWAITSFILLHHFYSGLIPPIRSIAMICLIWIVSFLLNMPIVVSSHGTLVDTDTCTLIPENYGWVIYVTTVNFFLPTFVLAPFFIAYFRITNSLGQRFDLGGGFLADKEEKESSIGGSGFSNVHVEIQSLNNGENCLHGDKEMCELCEDDFSLYEDLYRKPSIQTRLFLLSDADFPRAIIALAALHGLTWGPFYILVLLVPVLSTPVPSLASLITAWIGYTQCAITPILIYLLSDRVYKTINDLISFVGELVGIRKRHFQGNGITV